MLVNASGRDSGHRHKQKKLPVRRRYSGHPNASNHRRTRSSMRCHDEITHTSRV